MLKLGCHLSSSKGFLNMGKEAVSINANTFQFFTRNPRGGAAKELDLEDIKKYITFAKEHNIGPLVAHAPYTMNPASKDENIRNFTARMIRDDLERLEHIPNNYYNFHPGSHVGQGVEIGTKYIIEMLNKVLTNDLTTTVLLETMSGKGSEIGRSFDELKAIIDNTSLKHKLGVCLDTCHVFSAGYDIKNNLDGVLEELDKKIGLSRLKAIHLNDTMTPFTSNKDRHQKIGDGNLGLEAIVKLMQNKYLKDLPFILETPNEIKGYETEIALLRANVS
ncbi:MAG: deoxyribonuclease IV [Bdellovibrionota bacterium]